MNRKKPKQSPKRVLRLPDLDFAKSAVLNTLRSPESKRSYRFAIDDFVAWYCSEPRIAFKQDRRAPLSTRTRVAPIVVLHDQPSAGGGSPTRIRGGRHRLAQPRVGRRHPQGERHQESWCSARELAQR